MVFQTRLLVETHGRGTYDISAKVAAKVSSSTVSTGTCQVFIRHTSASLLICENADPAVMRDLEAWMSRAVPDGDPLFTHVAEGPDDMPAHVRSVLTQTTLQMPVLDGKLGLGTWQGIYLWEHRHAAHRRELIVTISG
ncbi:MAG: secondary thiamine-phosphate synthase enzyme YjbQ [Woeseia sp.]